MSKTRTRKHPQPRHAQAVATVTVDDTPIPAVPALQHVPATGTTTRTPMPRRPVSLIKLHHRPRRARRPQTLTVSPLELDLAANAAQAALYTGTLRIHAPYATWTGMSTNQATCLINPDDPGSIRLMYRWSVDGSSLTATQQCRHQQWHAAPINGPRNLLDFAQQTAGCDTHNPRAIRARHLGNSIHRSSASAADTQQTDVHALRDTHAADHETAKEHPGDD